MYMKMYIGGEKSTVYSLEGLKDTYSIALCF